MRLVGSVFALSVVVLGSVPVALADPPVTTTGEPIPSVFCIRIMDIERVDLADGSANDFVLDFEILNWTNRAATGFFMAANAATSTVAGTRPMIVGAGVDRDGRGGAPGGSDIDASGFGLRSGQGTFDATAAHSGRGRGDLAGHLNDWSATTLGASGTGTFARWDAGASGTAIASRDLIGASAPGGILPISLIPGTGFDALSDSAIDGGPGPYTPTAPPNGGGPPSPDGSGNVLDGLTVTIQDWDIGETLSTNWFLLDQQGSIGTANTGNAFGFGALNVRRLNPGDALPGAALQGNTGFVQSQELFFGNVFDIPNPAEFGAEVGAGITAPFLVGGDNIVNADINVEPVPEPSVVVTCLVLCLGAIAVGYRRTRKKRLLPQQA